MIRPALAIAVSLAGAPELRPMRVPPALAEVTSAPEPSGLLWSPALSRYLVVSDDTGLAARGTRHAPWLLAMDAGGTLDAAPVPIDGVDALNDAEGICAGPGETLFLATSHSANREGRTPRARRQLLHLRLEGRRLTVLGRLDLTEAAGQALRASGPDAAARLDVEAIAFRDGALYVGLRSPLAGGGRAVILRLADAEEAVRGGRVPAGALTRWAELPLCLDGGRVCHGIADLLFLEDGSLLAAGNAPKGGAPDGGGGVWWIPAPVGVAAPRLLRRFPGLEPEGLARSPRGGIAVALDRDGDAPLWTELPLPTPASGGGGPRSR